MSTMKMVCQRCGAEGEIEVKGLNRDAPLSRIFRQLGHNPYSGYLHYQCPACEIVLLVDPMTILDSLISELPELPRLKTGENKSGRRHQGESRVQGL